MSHPPRCEALVIGAFSDSTEGPFSSCYVMTNRGRARSMCGKCSLTAALGRAASDCRLLDVKLQSYE
jgi:hypothetical protein